jgi:hypothetical protein
MLKHVEHGVGLPDVNQFASAPVSDRNYNGARSRVAQYSKVVLRDQAVQPSRDGESLQKSVEAFLLHDRRRFRAFGGAARNYEWMGSHRELCLQLPSNTHIGFDHQG